MAEHEFPHVVLQDHDPDYTPIRGHEPVLPMDAVPPGATQELRASFQVDISNALRTRCPHCNKLNDGDGLLLNLTVGPVEEGVQVLLVRSGAALGVAVDDLRRALIDDALRKCGGNQARAAKQLGMKYTTFYALARRLGMVKRSSEAEKAQSAEDERSQSAANAAVG